jgi:hypothetical protein
MMNRVNQNNQLSSKSLFDDRQINYSLRSRYEKKILSRSFSSNRDNRLRYETKIDHEMKEIDLKIVFDRARKIRKESHLSNAASQRNHLSCLVCHLNQEKARRIISCWDLKQISKTISFWINRIFDEKTSSWVKFDNHSYLFVSVQSINYCCLTLFDSLNRENEHIEHRVNFVNAFDFQRSESSFRATLSFWLLWLIRFIDYEMHEKRHRFSANSEISIIQENDERFKSKRMNKNHEERKQLSFD